MSEITDPQDWDSLSDMVDVAREHPNTEIVLKDKSGSYQFRVLFNGTGMIYTDEGIRIPEAEARKVVWIVKGKRDAVL